MARRRVAACQGMDSGTSQAGQGLVEFVVGLPLLLLLLLGTLQVGLFYQARSTLTLAAFEAARDAADLARAQLQAQAAAQSARIELLNPTPAAFTDFAITRQGIRYLPNDNLALRPAGLGPASGQSLQDANLLKLRVTYGYPLTVPLVGPLLLHALQRLDPDPVHQAFLRQDRLPLVASATVRMQSPVEWSAAFQTPGQAGPGGSQGGTGAGGNGGTGGETQAGGPEMPSPSPIIIGGPSCSVDLGDDPGAALIGLPDLSTEPQRF